MHCIVPAQPEAFGHVSRETEKLEVDVNRGDFVPQKLDRPHELPRLHSACAYRRSSRCSQFDIPNCAVAIVSADCWAARTSELPTSSITSLARALVSA